MHPPVIAITGVKNSGKTTLVVKLVQALVARGLAIATIKHDAHQFEPDVPGRDSFRHRAAGAYGTAVFDKDKSMVIKDGQQTIEGLIAMFPEADIILLEGAKETAWPKIEIVRHGNSTAPVCDPKTLIGLVTDLPISLPCIPTFGLEDIGKLADLIVEYKKAYKEE